MKSKSSSDMEEKISLLTFPFKPQFVLRKGSSVQIESLDLCGPVNFDQEKEPIKTPKQKRTRKNKRVIAENPKKKPRKRKLKEIEAEENENDLEHELEGVENEKKEISEQKNGESQEKEENFVFEKAILENGNENELGENAKENPEVQETEESLHDENNGLENELELNVNEIRKKTHKEFDDQKEKELLGKIQTLAKKIEEEKSNAKTREKMLHENNKRLTNQLEAEKINSNLWEKKFKKLQEEYDEEKKRNKVLEDSVTEEKLKTEIQQKTNQELMRILTMWKCFFNMSFMFPNAGGGMPSMPNFNNFRQNLF